MPKIIKLKIECCQNVVQNIHYEQPIHRNIVLNYIIQYSDIYHNTKDLFLKFLTNNFKRNNTAEGKYRLLFNLTGNNKKKYNF